MILVCPNCHGNSKILYNRAFVFDCCYKIRVVLCDHLPHSFYGFILNNKDIFFLLNDCGHTKINFGENFYEVPCGIDVNQENLDNIFLFCKDILDNSHLI